MSNLTTNASDNSLSFFTGLANLPTARISSSSLYKAMLVTYVAKSECDASPTPWEEEAADMQGFRVIQFAVFQ